MGGRFKKLDALLVGLLFGFVFLIFVPAKVYGAAGVPKILNHQGRLFDTNENQLGGSGTDFCFKFSIYDNATVGLGTKLWPTSTTSFMTVNVKSGVFNVGIGDTSAGGDALDYNFQDNDSIFLNTEVANKVGPTCSPGDGVEVFETLGPRQRIFASGYAINADTIDGFHAAQSAIGNQIPALTTGNLIFGGVNPQINATTTNALILQGSASGDIQFFNSANKITSAGALTLAGGITAGTSTLSNISVTNFATSSFAGPLVIGGGAPTSTIKLKIVGGGIGLDNSQRIAWRNSVNTNDTFVIDMSGDTAFFRGGGGINIDGGGLFASGGIGINGESLFAPLVDSTTTFRLQNAVGSETLFTADTVNNRFKIGDDDTAGNPTTLLVMDTKADAGDPAGINGATYYNTNAQKFRCFENGGWKDCDTAGAGGTTFQGYSLLRDAVGVTMTNAASGGTEINNLVSRRQIDFTGMTNVRAQFAHSLNSATIQLRIDFSTSSCAAFNATPLVSAFGAAVGANNLQVSSFAAIPMAAKADVCVRAVIIGNGALDPTVRYITLDVN